MHAQHMGAAYADAHLQNDEHMILFEAVPRLELALDGPRLQSEPQVRSSDFAIGEDLRDDPLCRVARH